MAKKVAPVPRRFRTVTPCLVVRGAAAALDFYAEVFDAEILSRTHADDGTTLLHAEMKIGNSIVIVCDEQPDLGLHSPLALGGAAVVQHLYLPTLDAVWQRSVDCGCQILVPLVDTYYGERFGKVTDPFGHVWSMSKRVEALTSEEIQARRELSGGPDAEMAPTGSFVVSEIAAA